ncbi:MULTISPECIES: hypothetical protein [Burkholderiaceae]|jgi:hypothetical protein|uniref:Uncharacterized protein n=1 Tax=Burkholderia aenigmatica TaxID=2015348 RepID=A0A6J5JGH2_9BURK|nr:MULTISPECIES: hypothetical protein [Burkholderiaceae]KAB0601848.1 hypothetical protein F7R19_15215 [Cupriavidus pauculus]MBH9720526.1 hypothetical protein [Burkholderia contaminans]MBR8498371.1 hypothetical protein [Burkholderia cenocepacia]MCO8395339.1 hypothetical protein [Burkholderia cenocepacia]MCO8403208.1 hypothetical protein [Burkholderia cenocepacia]
MNNLETNLNDYLWYVRKHKKADKAAYSYLASLLSKKVSTIMLANKLSIELHDNGGSKGKAKI